MDDIHVGLVHGANHPLLRVDPLRHRPEDPRDFHPIGKEQGRTGRGKYRRPHTEEARDRSTHTHTHAKNSKQHQQQPTKAANRINQDGELHTYHS